MAKYSLDGKYDDLDELYEQSELDAGLIEDKHIITYRTKTIKSGIMPDTATNFRRPLRATQ